MSYMTVADTNISITNLIAGFIKMSRPPFHTVGVLPFLLGATMAYRMNNVFNLSLFLLSTIAVILIMLSTYYNGEYSDIKEDRLSFIHGKSAFAGGTQVIAQGMLPRSYAKIASYISLGLTIIAGLVIQFYFKTGIWTIPLGIVGILSGFFYSMMPIRWVSRGVGEILIGLCYGWLPVAVSYYLQVGEFSHMVYWVSLPVACTIFNVILINEFPDYPADLMAKKSNLLVRYGKTKGGILYIFMTVASWIFFVLSVHKGVPKTALMFYAPVFLIMVFLNIMVLLKKYENRKTLEVLCGLTLTVNLGTTLAYVLAYWL
ncbi:MAG TPA: prenyltransferase [Syntrophorhabdaceae bacterium]|nr:prenyltransferase [Syntrophorhabdaceae bacterium]HPP07207.1 prenyltransferase [Syntrophorhabdaceae bacterium]